MRTIAGFIELTHGKILPRRARARRFRKHAILSKIFASGGNHRRDRNRSVPLWITGGPSDSLNQSGRYPPARNSKPSPAGFPESWRVPTWRDLDRGPQGTLNQHSVLMTGCAVFVECVGEADEASAGLLWIEAKE